MDKILTSNFYHLLSKFNMEQTVVLIKPDGVKRGLVGEIVTRFERAGIKIAAMKMVWVEEELVSKHYPDSEDYLRNLGRKSLESYQKYGQDPKEELGTKDGLEIGKMVRKWLVDFIVSGPVVAVLFEGPHVVEQVRMMVGATIPAQAVPGTIRGDFSIESADVANSQKRPVANLVHASGSVEEAEFEKQLWFHKEEIHKYKRLGEE